MAFGTHGNFWVADSSNNRVLKFVAPFKTGIKARLVVGQADLFPMNVPILPPRLAYALPRESRLTLAAAFGWL